MTPEQALAAAIRIVGGKAALAAAIAALDPTFRRTPQAVGQWKRCPAEMVQIVLEAISVARDLPVPTAHDLRPDIFPNPGRLTAARSSTSKTVKKPRKQRT
jgi:hypothetical protein